MKQESPIRRVPRPVPKPDPELDKKYEEWLKQEGGKRK